MAWPAIWHGDWVRALRNAIEDASGKPWQTALFDTPIFSEYQLYGVFVEEAMEPTELQVRRTPLHAGLWQRSDVAAFLRQPVAYVDSLAGKPLTLVVQSNLNIPVHEYERAVGTLLSDPRNNAGCGKHSAGG